MTIRISSSRLKARMGHYIRAVRSGKEVVVTDRDEPVARLVPYREPPGVSAGEPVLERPRDRAAPALGHVQVRPIRYSGKSTTALLREDRRRR
ncbi:MAG: type II toxin-antitoxin system prevent-host-death family antitoxin [Deltaproteobacteria bacterium]|nr:MAG: type II toxin-antitoxin system prevent-host-death family antitoxin [Deltaproteobacteria bacterium]TMB30570.1 MAG: type II toxin-antitoxin system prevent-host-death family antitoxin [Deltaproteobacteria bacterium]TMB32075.1 MAG: type II toxin-antitoxin system prevent-host-death family antitoxin [Deltaproteobacteria bacterium]